MLPAGRSDSERFPGAGGGLDANRGENRRRCRPILPTPHVRSSGAGTTTTREHHREEDLPAKEEEARSDPRLPGPQQDPLGTGDPQAPAAEGPQAAHPLTLADPGRRDARPRRRLSRSGDFDRVYRDGSSRGNRFLVLYSFARGDEEASGDSRLGISVGRRIGGAVQRNKVKRAIRESFWELAGDLPAGHDYVIVARPGVEGLVDRDGAKGVEESLSELVRDDGGERLS